MEPFEVETFCTMLAQKSQSQREDQDLASQIVVAKGERGILTEQLALKLLRSFRGISALFRPFPNRTPRSSRECLSTPWQKTVLMIPTVPLSPKAQLLLIDINRF